MTEKAESSISTRGLAAAGVIGIAAGCFIVQRYDPNTAGFFPTCALYTLTGFHCPGCGLTRGFHALFNGDALAAVDYNALLPVFAVFFGYAWLSLIFTAVRGRGLPFKMIPVSLAWVFLGVSLAFAVLRNLPFYPLNILAP